MNNKGVDCDDDIYTIQYADISQEKFDRPIEFKALETKLPGKGMSFIDSVGTKFYFRSSYGVSNYKIICVSCYHSIITRLLHLPLQFKKK